MSKEGEYGTTCGERLQFASEWDGTVEAAAASLAGGAVFEICA